MAKPNRKIVLPATTPAIPAATPTDATVGSVSNTEPTKLTDTHTPDTRLPPGIAASTATNTAASTPAPADANEQDNGPDEVPQALQGNKIVQSKALYWQKARELGDSKIKGENSLMSLAELALEGGREGRLMVDSDPKENDARKLYDAFRNPNAGLRKPRYADPTVLNEASVNSNVKKIEWFIKLGFTFHDDGVKLFNDTRGVYKQLINDGEKRKSMKYTAEYEAVLSIIRTFVMDAEAAEKAKQPEPDFPELEDIELALLKKEDKKDKTAWEILIDAWKQIDKANEGRAADPKKNLLHRSGLKDDRLFDVLQTLQAVIGDQGLEAETEFKKQTSPPVKAPKGGKRRKGTKKGPPGTNAAADETTEQEAQEDAANDQAANEEETVEATVE